MILGEMSDLRETSDFWMEPNECSLIQQHCETMDDVQHISSAISMDSILDLSAAKVIT